MKLSLSLKTLFRTPLKTLLTFLLLAATSYMLFFNVAEYAVTSREFERVVKYYYGVGGVEVEAARTYTYNIVTGIMYSLGDGSSHIYNMPTDFHLYTDPRITNNPYADVVDEYQYIGLSRAEIDAISSLPYVTGAHIRYMTAGVAADLRRSDIRKDYFDYTARFVIEATYYKSDDVLLAGVRMSDVGGSTEPAKYIGPYIDPYTEHDLFNAHYTTFDNYDILAGDPNWHWFKSQNKRNAALAQRGVIDGRSVYLQAFTFPPEMREQDGVVFGLTFAYSKRFDGMIHYGKNYYDEMYNPELFESLVPGERYIIVGRMDTNFDNDGYEMVLSDPATVGWWPPIYPLDGLPENYLELPEFAPLRELIEITNNDLHTLDVVYTDDMSSIMRFAEKKMILVEGRMLTEEDSESKNNVCVINQVVMQQNGLRLGDTISMKLGDTLFEQSSRVGAVASVRERYAETFTDEIEFEIVGVYRDTNPHSVKDDNQHWRYSASTVFVPLSFLPAEIPDDHVIKPGEFSFIIGDPRNISSFLKDSRYIIEDDLGLTLFFNDRGWQALESQIAQANTVAMVRLPLFVLAVLIAIFLTVHLFIGRKRKEYAIMRALGTQRRIANRSLFIPLGVLAVFAFTIGSVLAYVIAGNTMEGALTAITEQGFDADTTIPASIVIICAVSALASLTLVTAFMLRRIGQKPPLELLQAGAKIAVRSARVAGGVTPAAGDAPNIPARKHGTPPETRLDSSGKSAKRQSAASHAMGYIVKHIRRTPVKSMLSIGLALLLVGVIGQFTLIRGIYRDIYENIEVKAFVFDGLPLSALGNIDLQAYLKESYYEKTLTMYECNSQQVNIVMTNDIRRFNEDAIDVEFLEGYDSSAIGVINTSENNICVLSSAFMEAYGIELGSAVRFNRSGYDESAAVYTVVGRVVSGSAPDLAFVPVGSGLNRTLSEFDRRIVFDYVEYTLMSPRYADEFRQLARVWTLGSSFFMDTSEADNMYRTVSLLEVLYPTAVTIAIIMGGLFPGLIVMQSAREASIMRVLGTTKKRTRVMLVLEQAILCVIGVLCAVALLLAINGIMVAAYTGTLSVYSAMNIAACAGGASVCAVIITKRRVLELLQVKE